MFADGGLERGRGCEGEDEFDIETRGDDEGVDAGVSFGVDGGEVLYTEGGGGSGCETRRKKPSLAPITNGVTCAARSAAERRVVWTCQKLVAG